MWVRPPTFGVFLDSPKLCVYAMRPDHDFECMGVLWSTPRRLVRSHRSPSTLKKKSSPASDSAPPRPFTPCAHHSPRN